MTFFFKLFILYFSSGCWLVIVLVLMLLPHLKVMVSLSHVHRQLGQQEVV